MANITQPELNRRQLLQAASGFAAASAWARMAGADDMPKITQPRGTASRIAIRLGKESGETTLIDNQIEGFAVDVEDLR